MTPFVFNSFAKTIHWILKSYLHLNVDQYLNTLIAVVSALKAMLAILLQYIQNYEWIINILRILRQESKKKSKIIIIIFGIIIISNILVTSLSHNKLTNSIALTEAALLHNTFILEKKQLLINYYHIMQ